MNSLLFTNRKYIKMPSRVNFRILRHLACCLLLGAFFFSLASLCLVRSSYGQEAAITDFTAANSETHLLIYLTVTNWLTQEMESAIHNGIPITFAFSVDLYVKSPNGQIKKSLHMNSTI